MKRQSETFHRTKNRVYEAVVHLILLYGSEMWPGLTDERMLVVFDNDSIRRISIREAQRLHANGGNAVYIPHYYTGAARPKKSPSV